MAEWLKAAVLKTVKGESSSRVRIPLSPHLTASSRRVFMTYSVLAVFRYRSRASSSSNPGGAAKKTKYRCDLVTYDVATTHVA